jgi:integrase
MHNKPHICDASRFASYISVQIVSFIEYKVNVGGCAPESFLPVMHGFDGHCLKHPETPPCLKQETAPGFLNICKTKRSTARRAASIIRSFGKCPALAHRIAGVCIVPILIKRGGKTFAPYAFKHKEIAALLKAAADCRPKQGYAATPNTLNCMPCIFTMLYCAVMRVSEISSLKKEDVGLELGIIHISHAKNDSERIAAISRSLVDACRKCLKKSKAYPAVGIYFFTAALPIIKERFRQSGFTYISGDSLKMPASNIKGARLWPAAS